VYQVLAVDLDMPKRSLLITALWVLFAVVFAQDTPQDASQQPAENPTVASLVAKGDAALRASNYEEALASYSAAIKADPSNFNTYYKRAGLYLLRGKNKPALDDLNKVLALNPAFVQARSRRGKVHMALGNFETAKEDFSEVLKIKPDNDLAKTQLAALEKCSRDLEMGRAALDSGQYDEANRLLSEVLDVSTENVQARLLRTKVSMNLKQYHKMLEDTMAAMKQKSGNVEALYLRGKAFYLLGESEAAIKHYLEGLKYDPEHSQCKAEFKRLSRLEKAMKAGEEKLAQNLAKEALEDFDTALGLEPNSQFTTPSLYLSKCKCYLKLKDVAKTLEACNKALELDDSLVDAYINRAEAQMLAEDYDKAIHEWQKAREKQPQNNQINEGLHRAQRLQKMASRKDYYKILEITKVASEQEIRKAYRRLALIWHPDKHSGDQKAIAEKRYVEIAEAYEVLSNPETRARFDNGEDLQQQHGGGHPGGFNPFGGGGGGPFTFHFNFGGH
jgi:DnaJ family protein C protein 3